MLKYTKMMLTLCLMTTFSQADITVQSHATIKKPPNTTFFSLRVSQKGMSIKKMSRKLEEKKELYLNSLTGISSNLIYEIKGRIIQKQDSYNDDSPMILGMSDIIVVKFPPDISTLNKVLEVIVDNEIDIGEEYSEDAVLYGLTNCDACIDEAIIIGLEKAKIKAQLIADKAGKKIVGIKDVKYLRESSCGGYRWYSEEFGCFTSKNINEVEVFVVVTVTYETE